jgi:hypothetical protein
MHDRFGAQWHWGCFLEVFVGREIVDIFLMDVMGLGLHFGAQSRG